MRHARPVQNRSVAEVAFLVGCARSVIGGPRSDLATTVEGSASHDGPVESEPLPVPVHLAIAHVSACADAAVLVQRFEGRGLAHPPIVSRRGDIAGDQGLSALLDQGLFETVDRTVELGESVGGQSDGIRPV